MVGVLVGTVDGVSEGAFVAVLIDVNVTNVDVFVLGIDNSVGVNVDGAAEQAETNQIIKVINTWQQRVIQVLFFVCLSISFIRFIFC